MVNNLNELSWWVKDAESYEEIKRESQALAAGKLQVECHFTNIESILIEKIQKFENGAIFGCVAWLTNHRILEALSRVEIVQIVVQKEDFLRPDMYSGPLNSKRLRESYDKIQCNLERHNMRYDAGLLAYMSDPTVDPIRCLGNHNSDKSPSSPRCHHKFLVFCEVEKRDKDSKYSLIDYTPKAVWTGSFNFSVNANVSLENVVYMESEESNPIFEAYLKEHHFAFGLSEPLDWSAPWVEPQYRVGS